MNHLKAFSCKSVLMVFLILNPYLYAENESSNPEKEEEKKVYIEEMVKEYEELEGFFASFRDPETNELYYIDYSRNTINND